MEPVASTEKTSDHRTRIVAVSGGIASGKTTVCRMLADLGAVIFNADSVARRLMEEDDGLKQDIVFAFGEGAYEEDGRLDRSYLASVVFADEQSRRRANAIVHPRVATAFERAREEAEDAGVPLLVHESALITEVRNLDVFDAIVIVESPLALRIDRAFERDDTSRESIEARARLQPSNADFRRVADYIIENTGTLDDLRREVRRVYDAVLARRTPDN